MEEIMERVSKIRKITLTMLNDAEGAWLKIPRRLLDQVGLSSYVSNKSAQRKESVYLDAKEDVPMVLLRLKREKINYRIKNVTTKKSSKVRSYDPYIKEI